jgi:hypothetical protein
LIGVAQGYTSSWDGGKTSDITGTLNERLAVWRSEYAESHTTATPGAGPART